MSTVTLHAAQVRGSPFLRYSFVVAGLWCIDVALFALLYGILGIALTITLIRLGGGLASLVIHKRFSFGQFGRVDPREATGFLLLWVAKLAVSVVGVTALVEVVGGYPVVVKIVIDLMVFFVSFLVLDRIFTRRHARANEVIQ